MIGIFQNYKQYSEWLSNNWDKSKRGNELIVKAGLVVEKTVSCNGNPYRQLNETEYLEMESKKEGITIPF